MVSLRDALRGGKIGGGCPPTPVPLGAVSPSISLAPGAASRVLHCCREHAIPPCTSLLAPAGSRRNQQVSAGSRKGRCPVEEIIEDAEVVTRVAALDIGKASLVACVRVPHEDKPGRRVQEVRTFATTTAALPGAAGLAGLPGRDLVRDGGHLHVLEAAVLP